MVDGEGEPYRPSPPTLASYPHVVRRHFEVPDGYKLLCGLSIGYAADAPANRYRPGRIGIDELVVPVRPAAPPCDAELDARSLSCPI